MSAWTAFYWGDYLRDTQDLTLTQHGAYLKMLAHYYCNQGTLPKESSRLYRICGAFDKHEQAAVDDVVSRFFEETARGYTHARADEELERRRLQSEKAKMAAATRWNKGKVTKFPGSKGGPSNA